MGCRRLTLLAMAVASLLAADHVIAASKSAPRSSHRRSSSSTGPQTAGRSSRRTTRDEEWDTHETDKMGGMTANSFRRSTRTRRSRRVQSEGSMSSRKHTSSSSSSRNNSRYKVAGKSGGRERKRHGRGHGMELVPSRTSSPKTGVLAGIAATVKGKAAAIQEDAKEKMTEWRHLAKTTLSFSSKMEKFMIQMTWPDDNLLDDGWVKDTINFLESAGQQPARSPNNPNKRVLRKLWLRMTEHDYRTKLKALEILHHSAMDLTPEAFARVRNQFARMRDETNHKNRNEVYFEPARIMDVSSSGTPFLPLLRSYSSFSFRRITEVHGSPQQLASILRSKKTSQAEAVALLRRLDKLVCIGTRCKVDRKTLNSITGQVVNLAARDTMSLWRLYVKGLKRLLKGGYKEGEMASPDAVLQLLKQYSATREMLLSYLAHHKKIVRDRGVFEENQLDPAALESYLETFASEPAPAEGEDDENEEDDEDEKVHDEYGRPQEGSYTV